jgi:hypothetical protein
MIDRYLSELRAALTVPARLRRRALLEARDHLESAAERGRSEGLDDAAAQAAAVAAHGPPALIARRYAETLAQGAAQIATVAGLAAVLAFAALFAVATQFAPVHAGGAAEAVGWLAVQLALTCAALSSARALRHRADHAVPAGTLRLINRGWAVALGAVLVSVGADLAAGYGAGAWGSGLLLATATTAAGALIAVAGLGLSARRTRELAGLADEPAGDDALGDLLAVCRGAGERLLPAGALDRATAAARAHLWRACLLLALTAGAALAVSHMVAEGPPTAGVPTALLVSLIFVGIEGTAILACFALLRTYLGIRPR